MAAVEAGIAAGLRKESLRAQKMKRVKKRTFYGVLCEQEVYYIRDNQDVKTSRPSERFRTEEERQAHKRAISQRNHAKLFNANMTPDCLYSTLTLDADNEVHDPKEMKRIERNYIRRLKRACPDAVIFAYIGFGKNTHRLHMHMATKGIPEETIIKLWPYGSIVKVSPLREHETYDGADHGPDYTNLANYLFNHWTPEIGGHRWFNTRNAVKPTEETPTLAIRNYSEAHPPTAPKGYILSETYVNKYGYMRFTYYKKPESRYMTKKRKAMEADDIHI